MRPNLAATLTAQILRDLGFGQSTADSIAHRLRIDTATIEKICRQLVAKQKLETLTIAQTLTVYRLR